MTSPVLPILCTALLFCEGCDEWNFTRLGPAPTGNAITVTPVAGNPGVPTFFDFSAPYPNPFDSVTTLEARIPQGANCDVFVQNALGDVIDKLGTTYLNPGSYAVKWDATKLGTRTLDDGMYFVTFRTELYTSSRIAKLQP